MLTVEFRSRRGPGGAGKVRWQRDGGCGERHERDGRSQPVRFFHPFPIGLVKSDECMASQGSRFRRVSFASGSSVPAIRAHAASKTFRTEISG